MNKWIIGICAVCALSGLVRQIVPTEKYKGIDVLLALLMISSVIVPFIISLKEIGGGQSLDILYEYVNQDGAVTAYGEYVMETVEKKLKEEIAEDVLKGCGMAPENVEIVLSSDDGGLFIESIKIITDIDIGEKLIKEISDKYECENVESAQL